MGLLARDRPIGTVNFHLLPKLFMDVETTGTGFEDGGEICEVGLVRVDPLNLEVLGELDLKFAVANPLGKPEAELSFKGYNGFTFAEWVDALPAEEAIRRLNEFAVNCVPWAYNVSFEFWWLDGYFQRFGVKWKGDYHWHCLMSVASEALKPDFLAGRITSLSLSSIGAFLGLGEESKPHRGLTGARYEHQLYRALDQRMTS